MHKQVVQWARLNKQMQAADARLHQAEQDTPPAQTSPPEFAKHQEAPANREEATLPVAVTTAADGRQEHLRAIASGLLYWRGGLKVLKQAQLPK